MTVSPLATENTSANEDRTFDNIIEYLEKERAQVAELAEEKIGRLEITIQELKRTSKVLEHTGTGDATKIEVEVDPKPSRSFDPPLSSSLYSMARGSIKPAEKKPASPKDSPADAAQALEDNEDAPDRPQATYYSFPPSRFILNSIEESILDYFPTRKTGPTAKDIFNKFYKSSVHDWSADKVREVKKELDRVLSQGVKKGLWSLQDNRYFASSPKK